MHPEHQRCLIGPEKAEPFHRRLLQGSLPIIAGLVGVKSMDSNGRVLEMLESKVRYHQLLRRITMSPSCKIDSVVRKLEDAPRSSSPFLLLNRNNEKEESFINSTCCPIVDDDTNTKLEQSDRTRLIAGVGHHVCAIAGIERLCVSVTSRQGLCLQHALGGH